jgi:DNA-binding CsgD family transcriptional regulator
MESMTERQREIFEWVKKGKTNWEIARIIGCSEENVKYHMKNILRLLGSYNRTQAVASHPPKKPSSHS